MNTTKWNKSITAEFAMFLVRDSKPDPCDSSTTSTFLSRFNDSKKYITTEIESSTDTSRLPDISVAISDLEKFVAKISYPLPSNKIRSSLKTGS
ncbi:hypothetical protein Ddye_020636 [Dipteronia dyeriana]|uniref:Tubulin-specific chaperone C N-terminal domain-containing protein n=1 Tax=Dipteronia dyeriana TaxID=168575 RepID=A0AAD9U0W7_9ROSI|nr:hypothetical protein Ddye_020636 [Dipteronia dyeriana]